MKLFALVSSFLLAAVSSMAFADGYVGIYTVRPNPSLPNKPHNPWTTWKFTTYFGCYDYYEARPINCTYALEVTGPKEPGTEIANNGGHAHPQPRPLSLGNKPLQTSGFDGDPRPFGTLGFTAEGGNRHGFVTHEMPEASGSLSGNATLILPWPPWYCAYDCFTFNSSRWDVTYEIRVKGLTLDPLPARVGQHHAVVRGDDPVPEGSTEHPQGTHGAPDAIAALLRIAKEYHEFTGYRLSINDVSLPYGGIFDLEFDYKPSHHRHRLGRDADINRASGYDGPTIWCRDNYVLRFFVEEIAADAPLPLLMCENKIGEFVPPDDPEAYFYHILF